MQRNKSPPAVQVPVMGNKHFLNSFFNTFSFSCSFADSTTASKNPSKEFGERLGRRGFVVGAVTPAHALRELQQLHELRDLPIYPQEVTKQLVR